MSGPLAIAAVTAVLKDLLYDGLIEHDLSSIGSFTVTAMPPDRVVTGQTEVNQLNVFLYRVTPNQGWRNEGLPSRDAKGGRLTNPPLALDLHYLVTAYGAEDLNAEILLGYAMYLLHETPVVSRTQLRRVLGGGGSSGGSTVPSPLERLSAADLAEQVELIKIVPDYMSTEDLSKMWTAMQSRFRSSMAYTVSVVLIQSTGATQAALPVLSRGQSDRGAALVAGAPPTVSGVRPAASALLPAMRLGDDLLVGVAGLEGASSVAAVFENPRSALPPRELPVAQAGPASLLTHVPGPNDDPEVNGRWAVGLYNVALRVARPDSPSWTTNGVPIALAPSIAINPLKAPAGDFELTVTCRPRLLAEQATGATLIFGARTLAPKTVSTPVDTTSPSTLVFALRSVTAGEYVVRLRVDGIDSLPVSVGSSAQRPVFDDQQKVTVG